MAGLGEAVGGILTVLIILVIMLNYAVEVPGIDLTLENRTVTNTTDINPPGGQGYIQAPYIVPCDPGTPVYFIVNYSTYPTGNDFFILNGETVYLAGSEELSETFVIPEDYVTLDFSPYFNLSTTNITSYTLIYCSFSGCDMTYNACMDAKNARDLMDPAVLILPGILLILFFGALIVGLGGLRK